MAYWLEIDERVVRYFREAESISRQARIALTAGLHRDLREHGDALRQIADLRLAPGSPCFRYEIIIRDTDRLRIFRFIVNDAGAEHGVLRIVYADELAPHRPPGTS
jgi:hypothetical protein